MGPLSKIARCLVGIGEDELTKQEKNIFNILENLDILELEDTEGEREDSSEYVVRLTKIGKADWSR